MEEELELPKDTIIKLRQGAAALKKAEKFLEKAKRGGFDTSQREAELKTRREQFKKVRDAFFPGEPL